MDNLELEKRLKWYETKYGPYIEKPGLNNWRNLFRKPSFQDWTILFLLIMVLFIAYAYRMDMANAKEFLERGCPPCASNFDNMDPSYQNMPNLTLNYTLNPVIVVQNVKE